MIKYSFLSFTRFPAVLKPIRCMSMKSKLPTINPIPDPVEIEDKPVTAGEMNDAMKVYMDRVQKYNKFMADERLAFDIGKRHLANMMGRDSETFSQADIDKAIEYLFPCSLYERRARPLMKPPEDIFPSKKEAEFDETGRPFHFLFYTGKPNFYQILHDAVTILKELDELKNKVVCGFEAEPDNRPVRLDATSWLTKDTLEHNCKEPITDDEYEQAKLTIERIANHPFGDKYEYFVSKFINRLSEKHGLYKGKIPEILEDGRQRIYFPNIRRRNVVVNVSVIYPGSGKFVIDGKDVQYFRNVQYREAILFPLVLSNMVKKVDIEVITVQTAPLGGHTALAMAIRLGIARGVFHFVDEITRERMKLAGLLNNDRRTKERKRAGQEGARRKFTWKKR